MISNRLKELRMERDWSQEQLAEKCGTTQQTIQRYESGYLKISIGFLLRVSEVLKVYPSEVVPALAEAAQGKKNGGRSHQKTQNSTKEGIIDVLERYERYQREIMGLLRKHIEEELDEIEDIWDF